MNIERAQHKLIMGALLIVLLLIGTAAMVLPHATNGADGRDRVGAQMSPADALHRCDLLASDPDDPHRFEASVQESDFAPGPAIRACKEAVRLNPNEPRAAFQLARAYWISRHDDEAYDAFVVSLKSDYCAAKSYIARAFLLNRGVPADKPRTADTVLYWLEEAKACGVTGLDPSIEELELQVKKHTFDRSLFQLPDNMQALYDNEYMNVDNPIQLAYYAQGLVEQLDNPNTTLFLDPKCRPLIDEIGTVIIGYTHILAMAKQVMASQGATDQEIVQKTARGAVDVLLLSDRYKGYGHRDAIVLFDVYGCESPVTQAVINNIMVRINLGDSSNPNLILPPRETPS